MSMYMYLWYMLILIISMILSAGYWLVKIAVIETKVKNQNRSAEDTIEN